MRYFLFCAVLGYAAAIEMFGREQSSAVKGRLMCDGRPAVGVKVKLWDVDRTDADDLMDEKYSDVNGEFHLAGWTKEYTTIDPKLSIYHDCNDGLKPCQRKFSILIPDSYVSHGKSPRKPCQRKFSILIPDSYVSHGKSPRKVYDAGTIQLSGSFPGESRDCIN
ncbi:Transthyretin-like family protein [Oesophagostomum dentatum]|uniref:Transthyretin-like family protein n=1 Tax=Oesophagostomum dentatum TaxID=61180 RepID=A0A0B1SNM6_OESDE|nr:Transthyretin-like family protein [Oesophagostomum dentatum]